MPEGGLTCGDWFMYPELHEALSLLVTGLPRMGKTEACKNHLFKLGLRRSPDNVRMAIFQTIDQTRDVGLGSDDVIMFDDIDPSDHANIIHSSGGIWKKMLQTPQLCQYRCRNRDSTIAAGIPRLITSNLESLQQFAGYASGGNATDKLAIVQRLCHVRVDQRLYAAEIRPISAMSRRALQIIAAQAEAVLEGALTEQVPE